MSRCRKCGPCFAFIALVRDVVTGKKTRYRVCKMVGVSQITEYVVIEARAMGLPVPQQPEKEEPEGKLPPEPKDKMREKTACAPWAEPARCIYGRCFLRGEHECLPAELETRRNSPLGCE